jgi:putative transposase
MPGGRNFAAELRDECLNGEIFYSLKEATVVIEQWRKHYNTIRPHSSLNYRPPAPQTSTALSSQLDRSYAMQ